MRILFFNEMIVTTKSFKSGLIKSFPMIWMSNFDDLFSSILKRFPVKVGNTEFRNDIVHVKTGSYNTSTI